MRDYQHEFLEFAINTGVLQFGTFTLKSGRISPYFFNTGLFNTGATLGKLGQYYAEAIIDSGIRFDMLFGPAYKGIPLVVATGIALAEKHGCNVPLAFDRKEVKDHGEGGLIVGAPIQGNVLLIDDVISAGTSVRLAQKLIHTEGGTLNGIAISLDRQERGQGKTSAINELEQSLGLRVTNIINLENLIEYLTEQSQMSQILENIQAYREQYGSE